MPDTPADWYGKKNTMPRGVTCHYERDRDGQWWVVWAPDFVGDGSGRMPAENSAELEAAYQKGWSDRVDYEIRHDLDD